MNTLLSWIDRIPLGVLVAMTAWMLVAPIVPEPHLIEKWHMLQQGTLTRPIDLFDVAWHLAPALVLVLRIGRRRRSL